LDKLKLMSVVHQHCCSSVHATLLALFWLLVSGISEKDKKSNIPFLEGSFELENRLSLGDLGGGTYPSCGLSVEVDCTVAMMETPDRR
jgi:hypothetical protein